jgi:transketolase
MDPDKSFFVSDEVRAHFAEAAGRGKETHAAWTKKMEGYAKEHPELHAQWEMCMAGKLPEGWDADLPVWESGKKAASRSAGGKAQAAVAAKVPWLFGGDADLGGSTKTVIPNGGSFNAKTGAGRNIHFGVREHAMGSICNGIAYHGGLRTFCATFFVFSDYMRPAVRLAALNHLPVVFVWTHDSVGLGENGPTHQPVEHLLAARSIPNLAVVRPADPNESSEAWAYAMSRTDGPTALVLSRQDLPVLDRKNSGKDGLARGAYVVADDGKTPDAIIVATGSEVSVAVEARQLLAKEGVSVRVVSMPCWEQFEAESAEYRESVLPAAVTARVAVEAGISLGWERWVGQNGGLVCIDRYGASAPGELIMERFGFTAENVAAKVREQLK